MIRPAIAVQRKVILISTREPPRPAARDLWESTIVAAAQQLPIMETEFGLPKEQMR
jgi:hypothetical protein